MRWLSELDDHANLVVQAGVGDYALFFLLSFPLSFPLTVLSVSPLLRMPIAVPTLARCCLTAVQCQGL
jgi:hypothetical protein